jgi:hypothetical protein
MPATASPQGPPSVPDWPPNIPVPGSAADAAADVALMSKGGTGAIPNADQPWLNDPSVNAAQAAGGQPPAANADQPWLNAPIVKRAAGAHPDEPWLDAPIVTPGGANADQPWLNDPPVKAADTSYGSALQEGLHDAGAGLGSTLSLLAKDAGWKGGQDFGQGMQNAVPAPANYKSASSDMIAKLKAGQIVAALKDLPRASVEGAPSVVGGLGAAAAGAALAPEAIVGGAGAALGAGLYGAASSFGQDAQARAAANGHAQPSAGDQLAAAPTAALQGGLNAVGLGKVPGVSGLLTRSPALLRSLAAGGLDAAGAGAANVAGQVGNTVGTAQGLTVDPDQAAAAALQGAAGRAGLMATGQAGRGAADAAGRAAGAVGNGVSIRRRPPCWAMIERA